MDLLTEELKLLDAVADYHSRHMDVTIAEAKRVASQYQEEALNFCMSCPRNSVHKILYINFVGLRFFVHHTSSTTFCMIQNFVNKTFFCSNLK